MAESNCSLGVFHSEKCVQAQRRVQAENGADPRLANAGLVRVWVRWVYPSVDYCCAHQLLMGPLQKRKRGIENPIYAR